MEIFFLRSLCFLFLLFGAGFAEESNDLSVVHDSNFGDAAVNDELAYKPSNDFQTQYKGGWELFSVNSGVSAMQMILQPNNKAIMFDATIFGPSQAPLAKGNCRPVPDGKDGEIDCWAHAVSFDVETGDIRPLKVLTDTWCSSGGLAIDGTLVQTGGWKDGGDVLRHLKSCDTCDWEEFPRGLSGQRWYSTQQILPDGNFILVGGRRMFNYEFIPAAGLPNRVNYQLPMLRETTDVEENNLYPFVHLSTDGNIFIFANNRSLLLDPNTKKVIREFPVLQGGSRNYPGSGMSALLPIKLHGKNADVIPAEVLICGGALPTAAKLAASGTFLPALTSCGRIQITKPKAAWKIEKMPTARVMGDMIILPTGDILMLNGAKTGVSGWNFAEEPNYTPVLYKPMNYKTERFFELEATTIPRMYHSSSALLPDGKVLVAGSNTNNGYLYPGNPKAKYPTELRVEKFLPPYLDAMLDIHRPAIDQSFEGKKLKYGEAFTVQINLFELGLFMDQKDMKVSIYAPPFTTHGYSMNQRLVFLAITEVQPLFPGVFRIGSLAPPSATIAPSGYYILYVVHRGVPSKGVWVHIS